MLLLLTLLHPKLFLRLRGWREPASLQLRLTLEVAVLAVVAMSGLACWAGMEMKQILVNTHKQNINYIAYLFPTQLELYADMVPFERGLKMTIDKLSNPELLIWVNDPDGKTVAQSASTGNTSIQMETLKSLKKMPNEAEVVQMGQKYLVMRGTPLQIQRRQVGDVFLAKDITADQMRWSDLVRNLIAVSIVATGVLMLAIAARIRRALHPLEQISQASRAISVDDLNTGQLQLHEAPSEIRGLVQAFNMMLSRLAGSWDQQREFVSNVSHELRTPLTIIHGYLQGLMRRSHDLNAYQQEAIATAASEAERTVHLLQDLLELARAESGHMYFRQEPLDLNLLLAEIAGMTEKFSNRIIALTATTEHIIIKSDHDRLQQVLINLVDNAVKYSPSDQPVDLILERNEQQVLIQVRDRGIGIPLQYQRRIFERFYRVDESRSAQDGTGLGLAIVKSLVEGMGGQIQVRSKPGEGSLFTVILPALQ